MFASESDFDDQSGLLRSGKRYKRNFESYTLGQNTDSNPVSPTASEPEENPSVGNPPVTPQRRPIIPKNPPQSEINPSLSIPIVGQSTPVSSPLPTSSPPPTPRRSTMAHMHDDIKLPVFEGTGLEDPEQFWFLCEAVWTAKTITDLLTGICDYARNGGDNPDQDP